MSTAIFGGTFDPVHNGHIKIAHSALEQFKLDRLVIVPNANPPHKKDEVNTDFNHRYNMLRLAFEGEDKVEISDFEAGEGKYHYSLYTMRYFRELYGEDTFFILGADSLCSVHLWYEADKFLAENRFIVFVRENDAGLMKTIEEYKSRGVELYLADMPFYDASSSKVRECFKQGKNPGDMLAPKVSEYIAENGLYGGRP